VRVSVGECAGHHAGHRRWRLYLRSWLPVRPVGWAGQRSVSAGTSGQSSNHASSFSSHMHSPFRSSTSVWSGGVWGGL
jgi:hypothetical protein